MSATNYTAPVFTLEEQKLGEALFNEGVAAFRADRIARGLHVAPVAHTLAEMEPSQSAGWFTVARLVIAMQLAATKGGAS